MSEKKKETIRFIKFVLFSISAGLIEYLSFTAFTELLKWDYSLCHLISLVLSVVWNFTLNRKFTFKSANNVPKAMLLVLGYYCVFTPVSTLLGGYLADTLLWNKYLVKALNMLMNFITEYFFDRFVVFKNSIDSNDAVKKEGETQ